MNIILLGRRKGKPLNVNLSASAVAAVFTMGLLMCALMGGVGYWAMSRFYTPDTLSLNLNSMDSRDQMKAMTARMVEMQARLIKLDALGEHLAENAKLNLDEFDFKKKAPMGGPLNDLSSLDSGAKLMVRLQEINQEIEHKEAELQAIDSLLSGQRSLPQNYLANMPVKTGYITSNFGYRTDPFTGQVAFHGGMDFAGEHGTDVFSVAAGVVTWAGPKAGYGNMVEVSHGDGMTTRYAHASRVAVKVGDVVSKGELVAYMGSTGRSTGTHLHYEVLSNGKQIDPATFIASARK